MRITGWEGNTICSFIEEIVEDCPLCGGFGEVDKDTCFEHLKEAGERGCRYECHKCPEIVPCPLCGGEGKEIRWR